MFLSALRIELAHPRTSLQLCLLGIVGGSFAALVIVLFRLGLELIQESILGSIAGYGNLPSQHLFLLPIAAVICIIALALLTGLSHYRMGIPFVIHRVKMYYGHIPLFTTINQFFSGMFALASGFVVGREGPTVHLGAAASQYAGLALQLPYNSIRILSGCGIAAAISAAFNTPFAAVIFVMEVVLREYKVYMFVPVILAAACGSMITRLVFGDTSELAFLNFHAINYWLIPYLVIFGVMLGLLGAFFNKTLIKIMKLFQSVNMIFRLLIAALLTGTVGYFFPEAMGAEFINIETLLTDLPSLQFLLLLIAMKFFLAVVAIGLGVPGGIIGAVMVIGMLAGVLLLQPLHLFMEVEPQTSNFALLGLAGMLTAVLHSPMAVLSAVMELSGSPDSIMPAMIVIVTAYVTARQFCREQSIFIQQLDFQGLPYTTSSIRETLQRTGVLALLDTEVTYFDEASKNTLFQFLSNNASANIVHTKTNNGTKVIEWVTLEKHGVIEPAPLAISEMAGLDSQTTLAEVYEILNTSRKGAVYIYDKESKNTIGIITWSGLHAYLFRKQH